MTVPNGDCAADDPDSEGVGGFDMLPDMLGVVKMGGAGICTRSSLVLVLDPVLPDGTGHGGGGGFKALPTIIEGASIMFTSPATSTDGVDETLACRPRESVGDSTHRSLGVW